LIGATSTYVTAPLGDPEWEIWGCNSLWPQCTDKDGAFRATRWFELHPMSVQTEAERKAIETCPVPIYTLEDESRWAKTSVVYPLDQVLKTFRYRYFTCTFAYQIALALMERFTTIALCGVELWQGTPRERYVEKACVEFWLGAAAGLGVELVLPEGSRMTQQALLYGYDYHAEKAKVEQDCTVLAYLVAQENGWIEGEDNAVPLREGHA